MKRILAIGLTYAACVPVVFFVLMAKGASPGAAERAQRDGDSDVALILWTLGGAALLCALVVAGAYALRAENTASKERK